MHTTFLKVKPESIVLLCTPILSTATALLAATTAPQRFVVGVRFMRRTRIWSGSSKSLSTVCVALLALSTKLLYKCFISQTRIITTSNVVICALYFLYNSNALPSRARAGAQENPYIFCKPSNSALDDHFPSVVSPSPTSV